MNKISLCGFLQSQNGRALPSETQAIVVVVHVSRHIHRNLSNLNRASHVRKASNRDHSRRTRTTRAKGSLRNSRSVDFWYFRISLSATVPGLNRGFLRPVATVLASLGLPAFLSGALWMAGGLPPVLLRAVAFFARPPPPVSPPLDLRDVEPTFVPELLVRWETVWAMGLRGER